jgi:methylenetetrahydrofolate dehydrogenase (NADP+) / methenyltetrahydrofolate cyclohydrolase
MAAEIIDGKNFAVEIKKDLHERIGKLKHKGVAPKLAAVQAGENEASALYTRQQKKSCESSGIEYELQILGPDSTEEDITGRIKQLNARDSVTGIILQLPLPGRMDPAAVQSIIAPGKDVEGVNPSNLGWITYGKPRLVPCTASAVLQLIESTGVSLYGKEAVVIGHSDIVGKPVSMLLVNRLATVSICHIATGERGLLPDYVRKAEILVVAAGKAGLVKGSWIREGAIVIDVGINRVEGKITGDVEFESACSRAGWITPVPGGVGPVTTAVLLQNTVHAAETAAGLR